VPAEIATSGTRIRDASVFVVRDESDALDPYRRARRALVEAIGGRVRPAS
jgi:hypothetical protein